ncbi:MAG: hypothetical protein K2X78_02960, partial [Burkholderiaceae bacterium]|nr:hypothetical protein [Burkholderiaceae bacterium]
MKRTTATMVAAIASAATMVATASVLPAYAGTTPNPTTPAGAPITTLGSAIVVQDQAGLRAAPRDSAQQQSSLWQGEVLEVRGERLDYLQVWDHKRERG